jgi:CubicO group peptidase (beta-lactamase class C family)
MIEPTQLAAKPEDLGIERAARNGVRSRQRDVDDGIVPSAQVAVPSWQLAGMHVWLGGAGRHREAATDDTLYHFFSSTKAVVSAAVWMILMKASPRRRWRTSS